MTSRQPWTENEDLILQSLIKKYGTGNWVLISEKMEIRTNANPRSGKQCRQRWYNHLDPSICKKSWTLHQQKIMFQAHQNYGNKWADIASELKNRSDSDVKNHFYAVIRKCLRRVSKMFGQKNSTQKIKNIKPSVLSKLLEDKTDSRCRQLSEALFKFILDRQSLNINSLEKKTKTILENLTDRIITLSSQNHENQNDQSEEQKYKCFEEQKKIRLRIPIKKMNQASKSTDQIIEKSQKKQKNQKKSKKIKKQRLQKRKSKIIKTEIFQKQNNCEDMKKDNLEQFQILLNKGSSLRLSGIDNSSPVVGFRWIEQTPNSKQKLSHRTSRIKESNNAQRFFFNDISMMPDQLGMKRRSSNEINDMRRIMSSNDKCSIYVTPLNPTPGYGQNLFQAWNLPGKITKEEIDEETQKIRKQISRNIQQIQN